MEYRINHRVRYSEVGSDHTVDLAQIINYFQDCSTFQSEDIGYRLDLLNEQHRAWILINWQIIVERYPAFGEEISIGTWAYDWKSIYGYRNYDIKDSNGHRIAYANALWVYMDMERQVPVRITPEVVERYGRSPRLEMDYAPRKIRPPKTYEEFPPFVVMNAHIDTNHHVNNAQYMRFAEEYLPDGFSIREIRAEYKNSALLHDMIYPRRTKTDTGYTIQLCNQDGDPYVIVEIQSH